MPKRILIVDDQEINRTMLQTVLQTMGYEAETASDGYEALATIKLDFDLVLMDIDMPHMDGFEVVRKIREDPDICDLPVCMVTGNSTKEDQLRAVEVGANDFIAKPVDMGELKIRAASLLKQKEAQDALKRHEKELKETVEKRTEALRKSLAEIAEAQRKNYEAHLDTIQRLARASEYKDPETGEHIIRVSLFCELLAKKMNRSPGEVEAITHSSPLHDVGKLGIPDHILTKPGKLDDVEWKVMRDHTTIGARILDGSPSELIQYGKEIALTHHERWDGSGYPNNLKEEDIPLSGRICAVADVFDALSSKRPYKEPFPMGKIIEIMKEGRGSHFDPQLLDLFLDNLDAVQAIQEKYA